MNLDEITKDIRQLLRHLGVDLTLPEFAGTPERVARFWSEFLTYDPGDVRVTFEAIQVDQMVIVKDIPTFAMCSHHLLPMELMVHVGYIPKAPPDGKVLGLSKVPRIVQKYAHTLQLQERLTAQIADELERVADPLGVAVVVEGLHSCMRMRGVKSSGKMITSDLRGAFRSVPEARQEFLTLVGF